MTGARVDIHGAAATYGSLPTFTQQPSNLTFYNFSIADIPGVVAANNFLSQFNPPGSTKNVLAYFLDVDSYAIGPSTTPNSMVAFRTTAASGGSLVAASTMSRFNPASPDPQVQIRTGNPTVITDAALSSQTIHFPPPVSSGATSGGTGASAIPPGASFLLPPGHGIVLQTAAGNTNQMWGFRMIWAEF